MNKLECWENDYDALQQENKQLKSQLQEKEKIIEGAIEYAKYYKEYLKCDGKDYLKPSRDYGLEENQVDELLSILERK